MRRGATLFLGAAATALLAYLVLSGVNVWRKAAFTPPHPPSPSARHDGGTEVLFIPKSKP